jgi:hypothetical protein
MVVAEKLYASLCLPILCPTLELQAPLTVLNRFLHRRGVKCKPVVDRTTGQPGE